MKLSALALLTLVAISPLTFAAPATLRSFGAKGDGTTDDRAAVEAALQKSAGQPLDGEGLTYAVNGNVTVSVPVDLRNLTLRQTAPTFDTSPYIRSVNSTATPAITPPDSLRKMVNGRPFLRADGVAVYPEDPVITGTAREELRKMLNIRTLAITGQADKPVSVKLEGVKILRGTNADAGMHGNAAGLYLVNVSPLSLTDVDISGDGKGSGLLIDRCHHVRLDRVNIHDIRWAPFQGDLEMTTANHGGEFGWNNSPIYDFDPHSYRFIRVRVQEQLAGLVLVISDDVEIINSRVERIGTTIDGKFVPWQADGMTISGVKKLTIRDCVITQVWEGIDLTGKGVDGFVQENIHISDTFSYGFKYAHPQKNGKVINCVSERAGYKGFTIGSECENIEFTNCVSRDTGANPYWVREGRERNGINGFHLLFESGLEPHGITLRNCRAESVDFPTKMEVGFATSEKANRPDLNIHLINPQVTGARLKPIDGFQPE